MQFLYEPSTGVTPYSKNQPKVILPENLLQKAKKLYIKENVFHKLSKEEIMNPVIKILVQRDKLSVIEAREAVAKCKERILADLDSTENIIREELGLGPDYLFDII